ncbi:hypothetical protein ScPMuIL_015378 [Solemya velum]
MARSVAWRRICSDLVFWRQCQALNATIYILRETGPTGFLLKEEGEPKPFKVYLGDPHKCTCSQFTKNRDLCKHLCWVLLKKFRIPQDNPVTWQQGLVEREINDILRGITAQLQKKQPINIHRKLVKDDRQALQQREIKDDDVCPICQDELLNKHLPVTYCKFGCGNSIHIKCMKVWADHQKTSGEKTIKCPFCREDFGSMELLNRENRNATGPPQGGRMDRHIGISCQSCYVSPIEGKCYRCGDCANYYLCQTCFNTPIHTHHAFEYRHKRNQRWRVAHRTYGAVLPQAVVDDLLNRDLSDNDYDVLMQLESNPSGTSNITENIIQSFPLEKVRDGSNLLAPGMQCRICLHGYLLGQFVRKLPHCKHKFHKDCIDSWLLHSHPTCPIDGNRVWDEARAQQEEQERRERHRQPPPRDNSSRKEDQEIMLEVPGVGYTRQREESSGPRRGSSQSLRRHHSERFRRPLTQASDVESVSTISTLELNGVALGGTPNGMDSADNLPGSRLLNRAKERRIFLNQQLMAMETDQRSEGDLGSKISSSSAGVLSPDSDMSLATESSGNLPLRNRFETQRAILSHLSIMQDDSNAPPEPNARRVGRRRPRNQSDSDYSMRSPNNVPHSERTRSTSHRELPPLIEADNESLVHEGTNQSSASSRKRSALFRKTITNYPPQHIPNSSEQEEVLGLIVGPSNSRSLSHPSLHTAVTNSAVQTLPKIEQPELSLNTNHGRSSAPAVVGEDLVLTFLDEGPKSQRWSRVDSEIKHDHVGSRDRRQIASENLLDRLQLFSNLYLGNNPRDAQPAGGSMRQGQGQGQGIPPRVPRRQPANINTRIRRWESLRTQRSSDIRLQGSSVQKLTLRDVLN